MDNHENQSVAKRKEFNKYCLSEIENNLATIESLIPDGTTQELDSSVVGTIMECAEQVEDLAMVYGYPGVESLAFNLATAMANFTHKKNLMPDDLGMRLQIAVNAIRQIVRTDDEFEEEKLIHEIMQTMQSSDSAGEEQKQDVPEVTEDPPPPPKEKTPPIPAEFAELELLANDDPDETQSPPQKAEQDSKTTPQFEIKELDSLMKLVEEIENNKKETQKPTPAEPESESSKNQSGTNAHQNQNSTKASVENRQAESQEPIQSNENEENSFNLNLSELAEKKSQRQDQAKEIEQVFNDIFKEETIENLDFLLQALQKTQDEKTLGEAIMRIKEACGGLRDVANCFQVKDAMKTMSLLDKLAKERLSFNQVPDDNVIKAIIIAEQQVRSFIEKGKPKNFDFNPLNNILKNTLESEADKETSTGFDQLLDKNFDLEGTIKVVEEEKLLGHEPEPKPKKKKKKVKVIFNDDDDRGRWMNKFK